MPTCDFPVLRCVEVYPFDWRQLVTEQETMVSHNDKSRTCGTTESHHQEFMLYSKSDAMIEFYVISPVLSPYAQALLVILTTNEPRSMVLM